MWHKQSCLTSVRRVLVTVVGTQSYKGDFEWKTEADQNVGSEAVKYHYTVKKP